MVGAHEPGRNVDGHWYAPTCAFEALSQCILLIFSLSQCLTFIVFPFFHMSRPQSPVAVACTWLLVWPYPTTEVDTGVSKWTRFHLACHGSRVGKTLGDEVRLLPRQRKHFGDPQLLWERELSHLAWCGGLYADTDTYARLLQERGGTAAMSEYLPLVSVGLSWKDSFR